ncbi:MAG: peptide chain release factor N(5)-glutamine methyltransferase [Rubricoccaceae bacterium]|nr:peptide chain release factor N(5)-glutamine methyltransferase [Rubricoccaceae bacterium]
MSTTRIAVLDALTEQLNGAGIEDARRNAEWILEDVLGLTRAELYAHGEVSITGREHEKAQSLVERRLTREPIQYVLGHTDFCGLRLKVSPAVLIPRPETEQVVEKVLHTIESIKAPWVLDVGTGSGAIAVAIKEKRPDAEVFACDISDAALEVAAENAAQLGLDITFIHSDVLDPTFANDVSPAFDLVVSNPPYVPNNEHDTLQVEVRAYEPNIALFVPDDDPLRFYRALSNLAPALLKPRGSLVVETHADYGSEVVSLFKESGLVDVELSMDLSGHPRIVTGCL